MNAKKAERQSGTLKTNSSSREAVESAISSSKGPRSTTWDDIIKKDWNKVRGWDMPIPEDKGKKRKAA